MEDVEESGSLKSLPKIEPQLKAAGEALQAARCHRCWLLRSSVWQIAGWAAGRDEMHCLCMSLLHSRALICTNMEDTDVGRVEIDITEIHQLSSLV